MQFKPFQKFVSQQPPIGAPAAGDMQYWFDAAGDASASETFAAQEARLNGQYASLSDATIQLINTTNTHRRGGRVAIIGDSISSGPRSDERIGQHYPNCRGQLWHDWWMFLVQQNVSCDGNWAIGAKNMNHCRDVQMTNVLSMKPLPDALVIAAGTNNSLATVDTTWGVLMDIVSMCVNAGIRPVMTTIPPHPVDGAHASTWNAMVRDFATEYDLPLVERNTPINSGGNEDLWNATYTADNVHPNAVGHRAMGIAIAADATLAGMFTTPVLAYQDDSTPTAAARNLAGPYWNTFTGWDVSAFAGGERFWLDRSSHESITFSQASIAKTASFVVTHTKDIVASMWLGLNNGSFCTVEITPRDASNNALASSTILDQTFQNDTGASLRGIIYAPVKAPPLTANFLVSILSYGTVWLESITIANAGPN